MMHLVSVRYNEQGNMTLEITGATAKDIGAFTSLFSTHSSFRIIGRDIEYMKAYDGLEEEATLNAEDRE